VIRRLSLPLLVLLAVAAGCGSDDATTACNTVSKTTVSSAIRAAGGAAATLDVTPNDEVNLTNCRWEATGTNVSVTIDSAPKAPLRYWHRITEQWEFYKQDPERNPQLVFGVGDDGTFGGAGAYWVPASGQLIALHGERIAIVALKLRGLDNKAQRGVAARIAQAALGTTGHAPSVKAPAVARIQLLTPRDGAVVREDHVRVRGAIVPPKGRVTVNGEHVEVAHGTFHVTVPLHAGANRIAVAASGGRAHPATLVVEVRRGTSPEAFAHRALRDHPGRVPRLLGERLDAAKEIVAEIGHRVRVIDVEDAPGPDDARIVCQTRPFPGKPLPRGERAVTLIADRDEPGACKSLGS
jgi:Glucodextranase, domain B